MGWASGSSLMSDLIKMIKPLKLSEKQREKFYKKCINAFEDHDCDTLDECLGKDKAYDKVFNKMHPPDEYEDEFDNYED